MASLSTELVGDRLASLQAMSQTARWSMENIELFPEEARVMVGRIADKILTIAAKRGNPDGYTLMNLVEPMENLLHAGMYLYVDYHFAWQNKVIAAVKNWGDEDTKSFRRHICKSNDERATAIAARAQADKAKDKARLEVCKDRMHAEQLKRAAEESDQELEAIKAMPDMGTW